MGLLIIKYKTNKLYNEQVCKNFLSNNLLKNLLIRQKIQYNQSSELYLSAFLPANRSGRPLFDVKYFIEEEEINCNCSFCNLTNSDKACSHVAALIESYNANNIINIDNNLEDINKVIEYSKNIQLYQQRQVQKEKDIQALNKLIKNIKQQETVKLINKIHVLPSITIQKNNNDEFDYYLSLKLGTVKLYVVKSIYDLLKLVKIGGYATYGKNVSINHNINNFDDTSKMLIKIVNDLLYLYIQNELLSSSASQTIRVSKRTIETIVNLYKNQEVKINNNDALVLLNDYTPSFSIEDSIFKLEGINNAIIIPGDDYDYIYRDGVIDRIICDEDLKPLLYFGSENNNYSIQNVKEEFFQQVFTRFSGDISVDDQFKKDLKIKNLEIGLYLDYNNEDEIVLDKKIYLENEEVTEEEIKDNEFLSYKLVKVNNLLDNLGFINNVISDMDQIINFLSSDLNDLRKYANVFLSERLRNTQVKKMETAISNLGYDVKMLSICFKNLSYDDEELYKIYKAIKRKTKYIRLNKDVILNLDTDEATKFVNTVDEFNLDEKHLSQKQEVPLYQSLKLMDDSSHLTKIEMDNKLKNILHDIANYKNNEFEILPHLKDFMREYQLDAFKWMKTLIKYNFSGILADDMGLGKTLEIISVITSDEIQGPTLIICPKSLIYNWKNEFIKWQTMIPVEMIVGGANDRANIILNISNNLKKVYITSYDSLKNDLEKYKKKKFRFVILDEAQFIKNHTTLKAKSVKEIKSEIRFVLTGTPIENTVVDLWSIFDFLMPNYLTNYTSFKSKFEKKINTISDRSIINLLVKKITPFILRRTKDEVLKDLPEKIEIVQYAQMSDEQRKVYESYVLHTKELLQSGDIIKLLSCLTRLRQLCVDPALFIDNYTGESTKLELAMEIINDRISSGHRILLFSQFTSIFDKLSEMLNKSGIKHFILTGQTKANERVDMANDFNKEDSDYKVFLISLKAGGTGLNLIGADTVIHLDPWWNVSAENQATDRAHRIGQKNIVNVIKIVCENSIEQKVIELQEKKKLVIDNVIANNDENITKLSSDDIKFLLS